MLRRAGRALGDLAKYERRFNDIPCETRVSPNGTGCDNVSQLKPSLPNPFPGRTQPPPPPITIDEELEYEISEIVDSKLDRQRKCPLLYLVRWQGYEDTDMEYSWLLADELEHTQEAIADFHMHYPDKPGPSNP